MEKFFPESLFKPEQAPDKDILDPETRIRAIYQQLACVLAEASLPLEKIVSGDVRLQSVLYMMYWFRRLRNNPEEQARIRENLAEYFGNSVPDSRVLANTLVTDEALQEPAKEYVEQFLLPVKTVDLVVVKQGVADEKQKDILCVDRSYYPFGSALPGGIIRDEDEDNSLQLPAHFFAALRVAGEKVLGLSSDQAEYGFANDEQGKKYFLVRGKGAVSGLRIYTEDEGGYRYRENIKSVLRPSDPRHIVDTIAFRCELEGEPPSDLAWREKAAIMSLEIPAGGFAFGHHREMVAHISSQTSLEKERQMQEREFIRSLIKNPLESYRALKERFKAGGNSPEVSFPELFPAVDKILAHMFTEDINELCRQIPILAGVRDKAAISLRHVCLKNRTFCPYLSTLRAMGEGLAFFDLVARQKKGFYDQMPKDRIVEHNPRTTPYASYHMYRYKYRLDQLLSMVPHQMVIRTLESLSATDLMRVRCVPIRFLGGAFNFIYVDEFDQSPEEGDAHDANHSWRMIMADKKACEELEITEEELIERSAAFSNKYLDYIKIRATDTQEQKEMKKLKKIILFEIVHEDARPFLREIISKYVQVKEGGSVPFEVPRVDPRTGYMDVVDTLDTGISTLSYVRNKLQHGFYDHLDAQLPQIVGIKYRTAKWIAKAAYEMLVELNALPEKDAELDSEGRVSYDWLLRRTCAVGPDNIHNPESVDPDVEKYGDEAERLNPKRYLV